MKHTAPYLRIAFITHLYQKAPIYLTTSGRMVLVQGDRIEIHYHIWTLIKGDLLSVKHVAHFFTKRQNVSAPKGPSSVAQEYKTERLTLNKCRFINWYKVLYILYLQQFQRLCVCSVHCDFPCIRALVVQSVTSSLSSSWIAMLPSSLAPPPWPTSGRSPVDR